MTERAFGCIVNLMTNAESTIEGWHFTGQPGVLANTGETFALGETLTIDGKIIPCERGFHASPTVRDALKYAPGPHLYRVTSSGTILPHGNPVDKYVASERTATAYCDAAPLLRVFARSCALDVLHLWDAPPVVVAVLRTGAEKLRRAADAAAAAATAAAVANAAAVAAGSYAGAITAHRERLEAWALAFIANGTLPDLADYAR